MFTRRMVFTQLALAGLVSALLRNEARAQTFTYDALGRVTGVQYPDGSTITYTYDPAGNRTQVVSVVSPPPPPPVFTRTIGLPSVGPVNLRTLADNEGYSGTQGANVTYQLAAGFTLAGVAGAPGGPAIDTGLWPSSTYPIALTLQISGKLYGGGGNGGSQGANGGAGGDALYCQENIAVTVNAGGEIKAAGGGGGAGGGWLIGEEGAEEPYYGGGGGGGFPNGTGGSGGPGGVGSNGTSSGGGAGGSAAAAGAARTCGAGGGGGGAASAGTNGSVATGAEGCNAHGLCRTKTTPGSAGVAGYAIRKNGKTVSVTNNGSISGAVA